MSIRADSTGFGDLSSEIYSATGLNHPTEDPNSTFSTGGIYDPTSIILNKDFDYYSNPQPDIVLRKGPGPIDPFQNQFGSIGKISGDYQFSSAPGINPLLILLGVGILLTFYGR